MSNETKRDVFEETLSNLKKMDAQIEGEWGYSQLTMGVGKHGDVESIREIAIAEIRDRYAAATDGETEAQRTCPYCHKPHRVIPTDDEFGLGGEPENFLRIGMTGGDVWNGIPPKLTLGGAIHTVMPVGYDNAEVDETISINYCPMCGRNLTGVEK